ncbi:coiled-coil domain-containing protein 60 isoform X2 [Hyla sarda]|uniref:coiled-coil domain-containing protein 60 isoform X2 n=1 Tax=Hyla sarda TaxID=327740 RepID=UPI0024C2E433|nr:coiled-coil domain-containing protein 60 isoform X2 [Hyla sarda]
MSVSVTKVTTLPGDTEKRRTRCTSGLLVCDTAGDMPGSQSDPRSYLLLRPLPTPSQKGLKVQARSSSHYSSWGQHSREDVFREHYYRRQRQLAQQGYSAPNYKPYEDLGHPLYLEAKKLILHSLGQDQQAIKPEETDAEKEMPEESRSEASSKSPLNKRTTSSGSSVYLRHRKKDTSSFNKELNHTRKLISSVKQGRGYFRILHQEEEGKKLETQQKQRLLQERNRTEPQPFRDSTEESSGDEEVISKPDNKTRFFVTEIGEQQRKEKRAMSRPFTPLHNSLFSKQVLDVDPETLFRQLCAIHWLLECLTSDSSLSMRPVSSCWNIRDPGGCKTSLKRINREKDVEMKWEQFIMPGKNKKQSQRLLRNHLQRPRKMSFLSISRYSGLSSAHTPTIGSVSSLVPSSDDMATGGTTSSDAPQEGGDDLESTVNSSLHTPGKRSKEEDEEPLSDYMQTLLQMIAENVTKELDEESKWKNNLPSDSSLTQIRETMSTDDQGSTKSITQRPKSSPATRLSPTNLFIKKKSSLSSAMRETFYDVADEADVYLHDKVEAIERRRQEFNTQKYQSLNAITNFRQDLEKMRKAYHHVKEEKDYTDTRNWFIMLLSRIPPSLKNNQKIHKILEKLEKLEEKQVIRIRPNSFLKVLHGLRTWELCSPDISVAIEFVREHLVQMSLEDYVTWLQARLASSPSSRAQSAPPQR